VSTPPGVVHAQHEGADRAGATALPASPVAVRAVAVSRKGLRAYIAFGSLPLAFLLVQIAGASYFINSFLLLVAPDLANIAFLVLAFVAELSLALWLLLKGVDASKWESRVRSTKATSGASGPKLGRDEAATATPVPG
jgi:hypothetical protein